MLMSSGFRDGHEDGRLETRGHRSRTPMGLSLGCVPRPGPRPVLDDTAGQLLHHRPQPGMGNTDAIFYVFDMGQGIALGIGSSGEAMQQEDNRIQWEHAAPG
jgi:hypothetical protein